MTGIGFRRRRRALTNYRHRLALVKSGFDRVAVRKSNRRIIAEVIRYDEKGDRVLSYIDSSALAAYKWPGRSNRLTAYLTGLLLAKKVSKGGNGTEYILDIGLSSPVRNSMPFMFAKGCTDGGMKLKSGVEIDDKVFGLGSGYAKSLKENDEKAYSRQFSGYIKQGTKPEELEALFKSVKERILKE